MNQTQLEADAHVALAQADFDRAIEYYAALVEQYPDIKTYSWQLGLAYLLQGDIAEAQMVWMLAIEDADLAAIAEYMIELMQMLRSAAEQQEAAGVFSTAWLIRQQMQEIGATDLTNTIESWRLAVQLGEATALDLLEALLEALRDPESEVEPVALFNLLQTVVEQNLFEPELFDLFQVCSQFIPSDSLVQLLLSRAEFLGYVAREYFLACRYAEWGLQLEPMHPRLKSFLAYFYGFEGSYDRSILLAQGCYDSGQTLNEKLSANSLILRSLMKAGGNWSEVAQISARQQQLLTDWLATEIDISVPPDFALFTSAFYYFPYLTDNPETYRALQNRAAVRCQQQLTSFLNQRHGDNYRLLPSPSTRSSRPLRIAYMSAGFRRHSIGWLARWVMQHHDYSQFEVYLYLRQQATISEFSQQWYVDRATCTRVLSGSPIEMAQTIAADEIDILIDLDSLTSDHACQIMAVKPAPIQVTWLGLDASGIPAVDYFIVDPYVVPENAHYYAEKLWRMPQTYIAVDGFEVGEMTLQRDQLDIPDDAIVYFSSQAGFKRHPDTVRLQMQILQAVPNSYFLIKGLGDEAQIRQLFEQIASEVGVALDRLRFLPIEEYEENHRANLALADVVLDTFPYNGATTTLETLWMGIPLVTKVGQQFAARNSYGMMINAGIQEGIAWSDQEYIDWGIRLGTNFMLRQQIKSQLHQSRNTVPLWNAQQFTRDLEQAYQQMWQKNTINT